MSVCSVEGCAKPRTARSLCGMHYRRLRTVGSPGSAAPLVEREGRAGCAIPGCAAPHYGLGLCSKHYQRKRRHGDPAYERSADDRFWSYVTESPSGCWLWVGAIGSNGYGVFRLSDKSASAHRYSWEQLVGQIPDGLHLDHLCRIRNCVNPAHLEPVTPRVNVQRGTSVRSTEIKE